MTFRKNSSRITITNTTKYRIPRKRLQDAFYLVAKKHNMDISLVFLSDTQMKKLNSTYRHQQYVPNVLAFPLNDVVGEICISPSVAEREARELSITVSRRLVELFIHGLLHLRGRDHQNDEDAKVMENEEECIYNQLRNGKKQYNYRS